MKLGLLARSEDRGLGIQSLEFFRNLPVDKVLIVEMGELAGGFPRHDDRYFDHPRSVATIATYKDGFFIDEAAIRHWLRGLDIVFSVETLYDPRFHLWAQEAGVATVIQLNPEFIKPDVFSPTEWWAPTRWRIDELGVEAKYIPVPVALDRFPSPNLIGPDGPLRVLHVVGHRAAADRNGTQIFFQSLRYLQSQIKVRVITQDSRVLPFQSRHRQGTEVVLGGVPDYWRLYDDADVLVLPRRYGGLSLIAQEALAAGLVPIMSDCSPNGDWPTVLVPARERGGLRAPGGMIPTWVANPRAVAAAIDQLASDRSDLEKRKVASRTWAEEHSWERLRPLYLSELERAASLARR